MTDTVADIKPLKTHLVSSSGGMFDENDDFQMRCFTDVINLAAKDYKLRFVLRLVQLGS